MTSTEATPDGGLDLSREGWSLQMIADPEFSRDPRPFFARLRSSPPARDERRLDGRPATVYISRHADVEQVLRDPGRFSSRFGDGSTGLGNDRPMIPLQIDPPEHKKYRVLLDPYLAPRRVARLEGDVVQLIDDLMDGFVERGTCDFLTDFAVPLPCTVFLRLLGLPLEDLDLFLRIKEGITRGNSEPTLDAQQAARVEAGRMCYEYFGSALDRIRAERIPGLLLDLMEAEIAGERLTPDEIMDICYLLIIAGLDTVTDSLCCFWVCLAEHPELRQMIVANPAIIPGAVEELMRWESPVSLVTRVATEDTVVGGCPVHKGESLMVLVGAANTDPEVIAGTVEFGRANNRHFAFGGGIHRCVGSHLARLELRLAMREWHRRIPEYRIAAGAGLVWTPLLRCVTSLPLVFP